MGEPQQQTQPSPSSTSSSESVYKNEQYLRLIREDDESWISGEELRTDGSSDDEKSPSPNHGPFDHHSSDNKKQSKRVKTRPKLMRCDSDEPPKDISIPVVPYGKMRLENDQSRFNTMNKNEDFFSEPGCSRNLNESLDLEINTWRPKRGSLKLPSPTDGLD